VKDFSGKTVYITGGSSGIGLETARLFASLGGDVVIFARDEERLASAARDIEGHRRSGSQKVHAVHMDVADPESVRTGIEEAIEKAGPPQVAIANAGVGYADLFIDTPHEAFDAVMKTNVYGVRSFVANVLPHMVGAKGTIVIVSSAAGLMGMYGYTTYGTSKYALVGFAECLRAELRTMGMTVTLVCPGEVDTPFVPKEAERLPFESRVVKSFCGRISPSRVAHAIVKGVAGKRFLVIPGVLTNLMFALHRFSNGMLTRYTSDLVVFVLRWYVSKQAARRR